jgi:RNA polymerase sigma-70 factor (ECF subfamily)
MGHADAELMLRWQQGDINAFEALVRRWQGPIGRFLARHVGREHSIADLCQEVFLRLYLAGARYHETGAFATWLYRIALNVARDATRRLRPYSGLNDSRILANGASAETGCVRRELAAAVARALAELPPNLREVLVLRHYEELNFEQIARILDVPASTLKSRFAVALRRVGTHLQQLGWGPEELDP